MDVFSHRTQVIRKSIASLHQNVNQLPLQHQNWLEDICEELHAILAELEVVQQAQRQLDEELEINLETVYEPIAQLSSGNQAGESEICDRQLLQQELELSLLRGTLEATADGMIVSQNGSIATFNQKFVQMWGIPESVIASRDLNQVLPLMLKQLKPEAAINQMRDLFTQPNAQGYGFELKDGRIFQCYSQPQQISGDTVVICSRDITERYAKEAALRESEERYRAVVEQSSEGIFLVDVQTLRILKANTAFCNLLGLTLEEILRLSLYDVVAHDKESIDCNIECILAQKHQFIGERRYRCQNDDLVDVEVNANLISYSGKEVLCVVVRDITERKQMEEALRKSEATNRALLDAIPDLMIRLTRNGTYLDFIPTKDFKTVVSEREVLGKNLSDILLPEMAQQRLHYIEQAFSTGETQLYEFQLEWDDGNVNYEEARIVVSGDDEVLVIVRDITTRKQMEEALRKSEERYRRIIETTSEGVWTIDANNKTTFANNRMAQMLGYSLDEILNKPVLRFVDEQWQAIAAVSLLHLGKGNRETFDFPLCRKDGSKVWVMVSANPIFNQAGQYAGALGMFTDITQRKQSEEALRAKEEFLQLILDNIPQFIFWKDRNSVYLGCNRNFAQAAGLTSAFEIVGKTDYDLPWKQEESNFFRECDVRVMETNTPEYHIIETQLQADGKQSWVDTSKIPLHDAQGNVVGILGSYEDITDRQIAQEKIRYQAMHDLLTGLPNRTLFNEQLSESLAKARHSHMLAVMFLDLDRFKTINDTLGHAVGDRLLQDVAQRLTTCLPENIVARWGGDEFTLLVSQLNTAEDVTEIAQQILDALKPVFSLEVPSPTSRSTSLHISTSIGIALYPQDGEDAETLIRNADAALYSAKKQGRNNYQFYRAAMNSQASELLVLENDLHQALHRGEFVVYYQPQVNTTTGEITGMEALVRWQHPQFGLVSPGKFIPIAEETGLIVPIGEWVLQTACSQNKAWQDAGFVQLRVAVNLSARQFQQPFLLNFVTQTLQQTRLSPQFLELEITETVAMQDVELTREILSNLYQMGIHLSMDDFGTGYSSIGYLKKFPLHTLKIDQSFIHDLATDPQNAEIINAIMILGKGFNLRVVAEGVETEAQKDCLRSFHCEEMQGYLSSPPLSAEEATQLLQNRLTINSIG